MVQPSFAIGIAIAFTTLSVDFVTALSIKSKTASGDGCPAEHWVAASVEVSTTRPNFPSISIQYPEVSAEQSTPFAAKSCQVLLELDQLPVGQQVAMTTIERDAMFYAYEANWSYE